MLGWTISSSFVCFGQRQGRLSWYLAHVQTGRDFVHKKKTKQNKKPKKTANGGAKRPAYQASNVNPVHEAAPYGRRKNKKNIVT